MDSYQFQSGHSRSSYQTSSTPFKLDEGFSEALPSQDENGQMTSAATAASFQGWVMAQNEESRSEIAYEVLRTLRTSSIAAVVERLTPLLHMDPVEKLPPELTSEIFAYLDAPTLLLASLASRTWRERILDTRLWKLVYNRQGWGFDAEEIRAFDNLRSGLLRSKGKSKAHSRDSNGSGGPPQHKKRATQGWLGHRDRRLSADTSRWREQHGRIEADADENVDEDQEMQDAPSEGLCTLSPPRPNKRQSQDSGDETSAFWDRNAEQQKELDDAYALAHLHPPLKPKLRLQEPSGTERVNWWFLFKQRRRLEENWLKGRFKNFQLPHPAYPQEAHTECVYTIQFFGKWLVSGSRDKTLRVWDLETRRLRGKPLVGHSQSVLCLQFDPTEDEDVIISGSSDTSIIVWRFSTGQKIHEIQQAHTESVLNLRFDHRYLITCSKDKLIKVWNRRDLLPTDPDYPRISKRSEARIPSYIIDISSYTIPQLTEMIEFQNIKPIRPYTNLMILSGHGAAVNAIQIDKDQIVSASGDRQIKMWDVGDGRLIRTVQGHMKGIACVQFDSRRIVSGSSDNSVRIFDPATGAEVAVLQGHTNLVRTIQAGFGDLPGSEEELDSQARAAERDYAEGLRNGTITDDPAPRSRRATTSRASSSLTPSRRVTFGASLPPGGGGSQWGRIVSGSYDESIIIWRKDATGEWLPSQKLRQEAAVRAIAEGHRASHSGVLRPSRLPDGTSAVVRSSSSSNVPSSHVFQQTTTPVLPNMSNTAQDLPVNLLHGPAASWNLPPSAVPQLPGQSNSTALSGDAMAGLVTGNMPPGAQQAMHQLNAHAQSVRQLAANQDAAYQGQLPSLRQAQTSTGAASTTGATGQSSATTPPQQQQAPAQTFHHQATNGQGQAQPPTASTANANNGQDDVLANGHPLLPAGSVSRVFKLQFDARRIICCSQDSRIIGWDFANGDEEIAQASRFFVGP